MAQRNVRSLLLLADEIDLSVKQELKKTIAVAKRAGQSPDEEAEEDQRIKKAWDSLQR